MTTDERYNKILDEIKKLFADKSVSIAEAKVGLMTLREEIDFMLDELEKGRY